MRTIINHDQTGAEGQQNQITSSIQNFLEASHHFQQVTVSFFFPSLCFLNLFLEDVLY